MSKQYSGKQNRAIIGSHNAICDISGFKCKIEDMVITWDGLLVRKDFADHRNPQDFIHGVPDLLPIQGKYVRVDDTVADAPHTDKTNNETNLIASLLEDS